MYNPAHFAEHDLALSVQLMRTRPFATVVGVLDGSPEIAHLPALVREREEQLLLAMHVARSNPIAALAKQGATLTAVFHGPHGYVSPRTYRSRPQVPTWNYAVVHASGRAHVLERAEEKLQHLEALVEYFESTRESPWEMAEAADLPSQLLHGIVAFEIHAERIETKIKLSQNRAPEDREAVLASYEVSENADERAMAALMRRA